MIAVYVTFANKKEAEEICGVLVDEKLIACANIFPCTSIHIWKDVKRKGEESIAIIKASEKNWGKIEKKIKELHSYETPCIVAYKSFKASKEYAEWVEGKK